MQPDLSCLLILDRQDMLESKLIMNDKSSKEVGRVGQPEN